MKNTRKLIPAIAMLLISAVMMSTASFAWFSTNSVATATGITVNVQAARNLSIAKGAAQTSGFASTQPLNLTGENMVPGSTTADPVAAPSFFYVSDASGIDTGNYAAVAGETEFAQATTAGLTANDDVVFVKQSISLMATGAYADGETDHGNIVASVTLSDAAVTAAAQSPVAKSLRVMLVVQNPSSTYTGAYIFAPVEGATASYKAVVAEGAFVDPTSLSTENVTVTTNGASVITAIESDAVWTVDIYVWFEGQDPACTAANAINLEDLDMTISFAFEP